MKWLRRAALAAVSALALAVLVLLALGLRPGASSIAQTIEIDRSPEAVWPWLREPAKLTSWVSWLVAVDPDPATPEGVGYRSVWTMEDRNNGNERVRIAGTATVWEPPHRLVAHVVAAEAFDGEQRYLLEPLPGGRTRLTSALRFRFTFWFARLLEPVITHQASEKMAGDVARLKADIETEPAARTAAAH